jgi:hypothetical protein
MNNERKVIELEQGWSFMQKGITKLKNLLEGVPEQQFSSEEYMLLYTYPESVYFHDSGLLGKLSGGFQGNGMFVGCLKVECDCLLLG